MSTFVGVVRQRGPVRSEHVLAVQMVGTDRSLGDAGVRRPGPAGTRGAEDAARLVRRHRGIHPR